MSPKKWLWYERYMMVIGPCTNLMFYLQAYRIFMCKQAGGVSLPAFVLAIIGLSSWLVYGLLWKNKVLIIANGVGIVGALWVLMGIAWYG